VRAPERVIEIAGAGVDGLAMSDDWFSTLEFLERDVDTFVAELAHCRFDAASAHRRAQVGERAAGHLEQHSVRARRHAENRGLGHFKEIVFAAIEALADEIAGLGSRDAFAEKGSQAHRQCSGRFDFRDNTHGVIRDLNERDALQSRGTF
jgi:hypothetical protein